VPEGYSRRAPSGKVSATISISLLTRCLRMQVSVELDIAGESDDATRLASCHSRRASVRTAMAGTSATVRAAPSARHPVRTFPRGGTAERGPTPSNHPPIVRSGQLPRPHTRNRWEGVCNEAREGERALRGKPRPATAQQGGASGLGVQVGSCLRCRQTQLPVEDQDGAAPTSSIAMEQKTVWIATFLH
jgi:hypothetical protein